MSAHLHPWAWRAAIDHSSPPTPLTSLKVSEYHVKRIYTVSIHPSRRETRPSPRYDHISTFRGKLSLSTTIVQKLLSSVPKVTFEIGRCRPSLRQSPRVAPRSKALVKCCLMVAFALFFFHEFRRKLQLKFFLMDQNDRKCIKNCKVGP